MPIKIDKSRLIADPMALATTLNRAQVAFLTDPHLRPPEAFWPLLEGSVPLGEYLEIVSRDDWDGQRERIRRRAQQELLNRIVDAQLQERLTEVREITEVRRWLYQLIKPTFDAEGNPFFSVAPHSLEGVIKAFREITLLLQTWREGVRDQLPQAQAVIDVAPADQPFSKEEIGDVARALLRKRLSEGKK